ncbi:hypothetical protein Vretimale_15306 [Volvox reticuliferus]|uniref:Peptidase M20 dimerisation domain-containing protein n=1 Tax=Volvox reticuliferus TaxID=1737510 RepID=A0A8J4GQA5_9CHLO|nr:hypothetical protein Vretifemale_16518 [Volvox reticuliferus]GIM11847.1 hypothetical protein Vretimale_15306 [Volvox reticuliferus]
MVGWAVLLAVIGFSQCMAQTVTVDGSKVVELLTRLANLSDHENPAVTRILFTQNDMLARRFVKDLMRENNLVVREDAMGNIFGRWEGSNPTGGVVLTGSHCDAIPLAGMYDGTLGVIGAIEAVAALQRSSFKPGRPIEVIMFTSEEPTRFGLSCSGSRAMAGTLTPEVLESKLDAGGQHFLQVANEVGYGAATTQEMLDAVRVLEGGIAYFVELHIEQGPLLEREGVDIGVVTAISAPAALEVKFAGDGGHAGGQLMPDRNDAGLAGAELALAVERHVLGTGSVDTVGTTGTFEIAPGAINSVPRDARLAIDIRDIDGPRRDGVVAAVLNSAEQIADQRKVRVASRIINQDPPATSHPNIVEAVATSADALGLSTKRMVSRAYHDSLFMARIAPMGMIFIPCKNGWSHRPDEFAKPSDIANGVRVLALTMARLSEGSWPKDEL